jgi:hypothetical protein
LFVEEYNDNDNDKQEQQEEEGAVIMQKSPEEEYFRLSMLAIKMQF